jgi:hypothetical protein
MSQIQSHLEAALEHLNLDDELDRLINPRHTDHDRHAYLPRKVASEIAKAREAIQAAIDELSEQRK